MIDSRTEELTLVGFLFDAHLRDQTLRAASSAEINDPELRRVYLAVEQFHHGGRLIDPVTIGEVTGLDAGLLDGLRRQAPISLNPAPYVELLRQKNLCRRAVTAGVELTEAGASGDLGRVTELAEQIPSRFESATPEAEPGVDVIDLIERQYESRWLIPGLMERADRAIIVGSEGGGKSLLLRQFGVLAASGLHPWSRIRVAPLRVLILDLENSEAQVSRSLKDLVRRTHGALPKGRLAVKVRPQGMDLTGRDDRLWLDSLLTQHRPDLLCFGSLYKSFRATEKRGKASEEAAELVTNALDDLRVRHDCALLIEAHAPHGDGGDRGGMRPIGSTVWQRWPEIGLGMRPDQDGGVKLVMFRGFRNADVARSWPAGLVRGNVWPWEPVGG